MTTSDDTTDLPAGADLAAELDDEPDPDLLADDEDDESEARDLYQGPVHGGPWDNHYGQSRYPKGFILVDMPTLAVWIYDWNPDGYFTARSNVPMQLDEAKRWHTANEGEYDILVPGAEMATP